MKSFRLALAVCGLLSLSLTGCCCRSLCGGGYGAGYAPAACPPTYGAGYGVAPSVMAPGGCPTGNCGVYPSSAFYTTPMAPATAYIAPPVTTAAVPMNPVPTY